MRRPETGFLVVAPATSSFASSKGLDGPSAKVKGGFSPSSKAPFPTARKPISNPIPIPVGLPTYSFDGTDSFTDVGSERVVSGAIPQLRLLASISQLGLLSPALRTSRSEDVIYPLRTYVDVEALRNPDERAVALIPQLVLETCIAVIVILGAASQTYAWRWTTPTVLCAFIFLAAFLAALNVPLSAYEVVQEFTSRPNDTLPALPFSKMIPEMLQHPTGGFTPQILTVGDTFNLNNSMFDWTITAAFDQLNNSQPVPSFSYYNNPFSDGCDVTNMTIMFTRESNRTRWNPQYMVYVTCHIRTLFTMSWNEVGRLQFEGTPAENDLYFLASALEHDVGGVILPVSPKSPKSLPTLGELDGFGITVQPCCECGEVAAPPSTELPTQAPCRLRPARFVRVVASFGYSHGAILEEVPQSRLLPGDDPSSEALNTMFLNTFQSLYHLVRLELGLILENQIYASAEMYNRSIAPVYVAGLDLDIGSNGSLPSISSAELMAEWQDFVSSIQDSDRVPVMLYLRSVPRLKPLGSAITSIFVSTFAMLSVLWKIFGIIAGALAGSQSGTAEDQNDEATVESILQMAINSVDRKAAMEEWDGSEASLSAPDKEDNASLHMLVQRLSLTGENNNIRTSIAMAEMQLSLARMRLALKTHGILAEGDERNRSDEDKDLTDVQHQYSHPLLVPPSNRRTSLDSLV
ncbi:hypothetical protein DFH09DRAFT_1366582 [Mycena vulgaris]|nr:hypothetical protein DFH09DRAFT_1366582 [Mycena vulgaris]